MAKYQVFKQISEVLDCTTGELKRIETLSFKKKEYDYFMKFYYNNILEKNSFPSETEIQLLSILISKMKFATIDIYINASLVKEIAATMDVTTRTIYSSIESLVKKGFIFSPFQHKYLLNPSYVFNGPEDDRIKALNQIEELYKSLQKDEDTNRTDNSIG